MKTMRMHKIERDPMALMESNTVFEKGTLLRLEGSDDMMLIADGVTEVTQLPSLRETVQNPDF